MAKQLSELIKKVNPAVVAAARAQADQEIFELRLAQLRQTVVVPCPAYIVSCIFNLVQTKALENAQLCRVASRQFKLDGVVGCAR